MAAAKKRKRSLFRPALVAGTLQNLSSLYYLDVYALSRRGQYDQIGRNLFTTWAILGYFLINQFLPKQAVSTHGLL